MGSVDDQTFRVNFSSDGVNLLRETVRDQLKEFMGDYTDDTLVEYVIVLLRNGRSKEEARNELNVFLGDDSYSFVSWLWEHLSSSLNLYVQHQESYTDEASNTKLVSEDSGVKTDSHRLDAEQERGKSDKLSRHRHNREWRGLARDAAEPPPLRSSKAENIHFEEKVHHKVGHPRRSPTSLHSDQRKRSRPDERPSMKREAVSQATINAPRRLLQFAVRDAVGTSRPSTSDKEPSLKRLRSVVSAPVEDMTSIDHPQRIRSVARVPNPMARVIKAVAEAAEDALKVKSGGSVFDRLGRGINVAGTAEQIADYTEGVVEDEEYDDFNQIQEGTQSIYHLKSDYGGQYDSDTTMMQSETGLPSDSMSKNDGYDEVNVMGRRVTDVPHTDTSGENRAGGSIILQHGVAKSDNMRIAYKDHAQTVASATASRNILDISVNVNTRKHSQYQKPGDVADMNVWNSVQKGDSGFGKSGLQLMKENNNLVTVSKGNAKPAQDIPEEFQKTQPSAPGLPIAGRPLEDADSRTIFVSNVHFAATKDSLSRHFNKFGEVLKVTIVTDAATGQPRGSAYVEFMRKEAADNALSLDGTSFMSRILKVVRRSSGHQEGAPITTWPRIARGSPFAAARFPRVPFPRGMSGTFRPRLPIKVGARSFQWKRDAQPTQAESGAFVPGGTVPSPTARSLTYIRTESKADGSAGTT
ncbi:hypothetical protein HS088_TW14G00568 [Tripterygium wilfordii]|uniref:RRM domain-containing protein n=1 Tax=Tripterygium wilfordii TaxID=458696 RepID=A0A7J7CRC5_TRIWF|nr:nucleolin 2-like [Tripterygium wilfordii]KAF5736426.1 hypothetical protein HS088_TW14G00568 [Tripterygium wilfordii]